MRTFYAYIHSKPDGTPFYVGKGCEKRAYNFGARNNVHKRIVAKYGAQNIGVLIFECDSEAAAHAMEIEYIRQFREAGVVLANICDGGEGATGAVRSAETRARMTAYHLNRPEKHCQNLSKALTGKRHSDATKAKLSALAKERNDPNPMLGRRHTPEAIAKMSAARRARSNYPRDTTSGRYVSPSLAN